MKEFNLVSCIELLNLIHTLRSQTQPINHEVDPLTHELMWSQVDCMITDMINKFKANLIDKESIEMLTGKTIESYEIQYDEHGCVKGVNVRPVQTLEYLEITMNIIPTGDDTNIS